MKIFDFYIDLNKISDGLLYNSTWTPIHVYPNRISNIIISPIITDWLFENNIMYTYEHPYIIFANNEDAILFRLRFG